MSSSVFEDDICKRFLNAIIKYTITNTIFLSEHICSNYMDYWCLQWSIFTLRENIEFREEGSVRGLGSPKLPVFDRGRRARPNGGHRAVRHCRLACVPWWRGKLGASDERNATSPRVQSWPHDLISTDLRRPRKKNDSLLFYSPNNYKIYKHLNNNNNKIRKERHGEKEET